MAIPLSVLSAHLRTSHLPTRACSTGLPSPHVIHTRYAPLLTRLLLLPPSWSWRWSTRSKVNGSHGNLPLIGGGCGRGKPGSGDQDDGPGEGFLVPNSSVEVIIPLLQLGVFKEPLLARDFLATIHSFIGIVNEEMNCPSSSHSTHRDEGSHCDGSSNHQLEVILQVHCNKHSDRTSTRAAQVGYVFTMAASSLAGALFLVPYWGFYCSDPTLCISKIWKNVFPIGHSFLIVTIVLLTAHSAQLKEEEIPDNARFKSLQIVQAVVLLCLWAGIFIPLHVCRGMPNLVVWIPAAGALLMIVISWSIVFEHKTVIKCIMAPCQMVIKFTKVMYEKVLQWLPDLSLPECIKAMFKKMPEEKSYPRP